MFAYNQMIIILTHNLKQIRTRKKTIKNNKKNEQSLADKNNEIKQTKEQK